MTQQDLTAPVDRVKVSRREQFKRAYELFDDDEQTPQNLTGWTFTGQLLLGSRLVQTLTQQAGIIRPGEPNAVIVSLNAILMGELVPGAYQLLLYMERPGDRVMVVQIAMQVE